LEYHVAKARENGAEEEEIKAAIAVGKLVRKGATEKMDQFASAMLKDTRAVPASTDEHCGCELT